MTVRRAVGSDLDQIVDVFLTCWRQSYAAVLPQSLIEMMTVDGAHELWARVVRESEPGDLLVASGSQHERLLAVARTGPVVDRIGHLASLYVWPGAQGTGVGRRLMESAMSHLEAAGATSATLWVFRDNAPSIAFYRHLGWAADGHERTQEQFGQPELRLVRSLAPDGWAGAR